MSNSHHKNFLSGIEPLEDRVLLNATPTLIDINAGAADSFPFQFTSLPTGNNTLFGAIFDSKGLELLKTNGTTSGTKLVKDINPGATSSNPHGFTNLYGDDEFLFFGATRASDGRELWKSNGTASGTIRVKDINPGAGDSLPNYLTDVNGTLFFSAYHPVHGRELWKTNGTAAGTVLVKDINPGADDSAPRNLQEVNGTLFFSAYTDNFGRELWKSDGTAAGTVLVKDLRTGSNGSYPYELTGLNNRVFFTAANGNGREIFHSDGTSAGTKILKNIRPGSYGSYPGLLQNINDTLFFAADNGTIGTELWMSHGTPGTTKLVKDINPGAGSGLNAFHSKFVNFNGYPVFFADDGVSGNELWKSNGTAAGTQLIKDINPGPGDSRSPYDYGSMVNGLGTLFFSAYDPTNGIELWKSNGKTAGTVLVKDILPGANDSYPHNLVQVDDSIFFSANHATRGNELYTICGLDFMGTPDDDLATVQLTVDQWKLKFNDVQFNLRGRRYSILGLGGSDRIEGWGSSQNDTITVGPDLFSFKTPGVSNLILDFSSVEKIDLFGGGGTNDRVFLTGTPGNDRLTSRPNVNMFNLSNGIMIKATAFDRSVIKSGGGTNDVATVFDSPDDNVFFGRPKVGIMTGPTFNNRVESLDRVNVLANSGGNDTLRYFDSSGNDSLTLRPTSSMFRGLGFFYDARKFDRTIAVANAGGNNDQVTAFDSSGNDTFFGQGHYGRLTGTEFANIFRGFDRATANAFAGGIDTLNTKNVFYVLNEHGTWENQP